MVYQYWNMPSLFSSVPHFFLAIITYFIYMLRPLQNDGSNR
jgi:hypothetical protein